MRSKELRRSTINRILVSLSISDSIMLCCQLLNKEFVRKFISVDPRALSDIGCKIFFHFYRTSKMSSSWLVVLVCFERYIAVLYPLKASSILTKRNISTIIAVIYIAVVTFNGVWTFSSSIVDGTCQQYHVRADTQELNRYFLIAGSFLYSIVPMFLLVFFTPRIIYRLITHQRRRSCLAPDRQVSVSSARISTMLVGVIVAFIVLILPITITHNLNAWKDVGGLILEKDTFKVLKNVSQIMEQLNYAGNFYMYVMTSNQFRQEVLNLLNLPKCCKTGSGATSSTTQSRGTLHTKQGSVQDSQYSKTNVSEVGSQQTTAEKNAITKF